MWLYNKTTTATTKMTIFDDVTKEKIEKNNANWPQLPGQPYKIFIICGSESGKTSYYSI